MTVIRLVLAIVLTSTFSARVESEDPHAAARAAATEFFAAVQAADLPRVHELSIVNGPEKSGLLTAIESAMSNAQEMRKLTQLLKDRGHDVPKPPADTGNCDAKRIEEAKELASGGDLAQARELVRKIRALEDPCESLKAEEEEKEAPVGELMEVPPVSPLE